MIESDYLLKLLNKALDDSEKVSVLVQRAARIARLRHDYVNLWWLEWELVNVTREEERKFVVGEIISHLTKAQLTHFWKKYYELWADERRVVHLDSKLNVSSKEMILAKSISEIENEVGYYSKMGAEAISPQGLHSLDLYYQEQSNIKLKAFARVGENNCKNIMSRVTYRVNSYLSNVETQIAFGQIYSDIFEENQLYVNEKLAEICPDALAKFVSAYKRGRENETESWAQALTSCRRLLKSLADVLYPSTGEHIEDSKGKRRKMTEEQYISRLWQYVYEHTSSSSGKLLQVQIQDYGNRIDSLYSLTNKGVHAEVSKFEVNQCLIQTYLIVGDLLRLKENVSAIDGMLEIDETAM